MSRVIFQSGYQHNVYFIPFIIRLSTPQNQTNDLATSHVSSITWAIRLQNFLSRVVTRTLHLARQLSDYFFSILSPFLSVYKRGYCCEAGLVRLIKDWRDALDNKCVVGAVSIDMSTAQLLPRQARCLRCCSSQSLNILRLSHKIVTLPLSLTNLYQSQHQMGPFWYPGNWKVRLAVQNQRNSFDQWVETLS